MATITLGTGSTTSLTSLVWQPGGLLAADLATMRNSIKNDQIATNPVFPGAIMNGQLFIPNRGVLTLLPGDYIGIDAYGWPILVAKNAVAYSSTSWVYS